MVGRMVDLSTIGNFDLDGYYYPLVRMPLDRK